MIASKNAIAKFAAVAAGIAFVASSFAAFAPQAQAATTEELEALIEQLQSELAALQGGSSGGSVTFTMDLTIGSTGAEVTALQNWLISEGYSIPAGATGYFGTQTQSALAAYQAANGISPAAGYFGPITRAKVNAAGGGSTGGSTGGGAGSAGLSGGEASLEDLQGSSGDDSEVEEGASAKVAEFEFDVEDGDVRVSRLDLGFYWDGVPGEEDEPWETFDTITLLDEDGDEIASEDVSEESDWLEEDSNDTTTPFIFRFSGLDWVIEEDEQGMFVVEVEAQNGIDGADTTIEWEVFVAEDGIRGIDGEGLDQYLGETDDDETALDESVTFDVVEEGEGEELNISSSPEDPDSTVLAVEDDGLSDWYTIFAFELDAEENDIELEDIEIVLQSSDSDVRTVVNDAMLVIDGEEFDDFDWSTEGTASSTLFDIDKDFTVGADETVTVEYMVEFKTFTGNYATGTSISASTTGTLITGEGADDVIADGSAQGDTHVLQEDGISASHVDDSAVTTVVENQDNDYATFEIEVEVEAFGADAFISQTATAAYAFQIENASTAAVLGTSTATTSTISTTADTEGSAYRISQNSSETFTFIITLDPLPANEGASYRAQLLALIFGETSGAPTGNTYTFSPEADYETNGTLIND